jgi:DNA-binding XRE family transcriptional regulator
VAYASRQGGDWLVILPKVAESLVTASAAPPTFIKLAHFGNLRGLDQHRNIAGLIVIGRPMPPPTDVERIAGILTGREIEQRVEGWYPTEVVHLVGRDGTAATVEADRHPDEIAEAVRRAICQDEMSQAVGRARGVSRTVANPVEVILLGNVPVPGLVPDTIEQWHAPSVDDEILARHGAVLEAAAHAAKVAGLTTKAVEHRRASLPPFSYEYYLYETGGNLRSALYQLRGPGRRRQRVLYQLTGPGRRRQRVAYDPRRIADIAGWLTDYLGPLAIFEAVTQPIQAGAETAAPADVSGPAPVVEVELPAAATVFRSGIVPPELRAWSRERRRAACVSQEEIARGIGISRPQLANAEAGRFGLSTETAARFLAIIAGLPERQAGLRF